MIGNLTRIALSVFLAMMISVMALPQLSEPELAQEDEWRIHIVDSAGRVGGSNSLALDRDDVPHISYWDQTNKSLKYVKWNGSGWFTETVDGSGQSTGMSPSIAVDKKGFPHIVYSSLLWVNKVTHSILKYAKWNGSAWNLETVDPGPWTGGYNSIALGKNDHPHISYYDNGQLGYAKWNGRAWNLQTVDSPPPGSTLLVGGWTSIALDKNNYPHISYYDRKNASIKYANWNGSAWNIEIVDTAGDHHTGPTSLALDRYDRPRICYYKNETGSLKYAEWNGTAWKIETVAYIGTLQAYSSMALDSDDNPHIGYSDYYDKELRYAVRNRTAWEIEIVHPAGYAVGPSLALDKKDNPHISYYNITDSDLRYATKTELAQVVRSITLDIDPDTLNLKSKGKWITAYFTTEDAYADGIDTSSLLLNDAISPAWWDIQNETVLMFKFDRAAVQAIVLVSDSVDIKVTGQWKDGDSFEVHDTIRVINPGR